MRNYSIYSFDVNLWFIRDNTPLSAMAHNLKAGIMATTTMVGSALAYTKAQAGEDRQQGQSVWGGSQSPTPSQAQSSAQYQDTVRGQTGASKYQDTVNQMMHWKY